MKKITQIFVAATAVVAFCLTAPNGAQAQAPASHVYHVNTWYMVTDLDSAARAERNAMLKEYHEKVTMKNEMVLHVTMMTHFFTEDSREFVTITEFASWGDITKSFDRDTELEKQAWPDAKQRNAFMTKMNSYFTYHKDAIYNGMTGMMK